MSTHNAGPHYPTRVIDDGGRDLLTALIRDPGATHAALAQTLGLARNTVQSRLARLDDAAAFMPLDHRINPISLGYPLAAYVSVQAEQRKLGTVVGKLSRIPEVIQAHGLTGQMDLLVYVVGRSAEDLFRIDGEILSIDGVLRTETSVAMSELIPHRVGPLIEASRANPAPRRPQK